MFSMGRRKSQKKSFPLGETQVTWTATDESGNVASAIQTVMVSDTVAPVITAPVGQLL